jgi:15-cis-phytoene synthase
LTADQHLSLAYAPSDLRQGFRAASILDDHFKMIAAAGRDPMLTRIKLAWWKEEGIHTPVAGTDVGDALVQLSHHLPEIAELIDAVDELYSEPDSLISAEQCGLAFFNLGLAVASQSLTDAIDQAARGWGLVDFGVRSQSDRALLAAANKFKHVNLGEFTKRIKPLGVLAALARRDAADGRSKMSSPGSPRRMKTALMFALFNR